MLDETTVAHRTTCQVFLLNSTTIRQLDYMQLCIFKCVHVILIANLKICDNTVNPGMLSQHQNRCKVLQLHGHRFGANLH